MKFHVVLIACLLSLAPALAKSVPRGARPSGPAPKLGYNAADPNLSSHRTSRGGSSAVSPLPTAYQPRATTNDYILQNLGVVQANLFEARPAPANTFFTFPRSTNPVVAPGDFGFEQKKAK